MINNNELEQQLLSISEIKHAAVGGDGYKFQILVVSNEFEGKTKIARQQWVYKQLKDLIISGQLHAVTLQTLTMEEWEKNNG